MNEMLHIQTPILESLPLSKQAGVSVLLKMEALQPSGSFKMRGIGHACRTYVDRGARRLIASSGGNAGLAVATAGRKLGVPVTVFVPTTTKQRAIDLITATNAEVVIYGANWDAAHAAAQSACGPEDAYLHPFDDPLIWEGHATMIDEVAAAGIQPDGVLLSVGGGGLLCGVVAGLQRNYAPEIPILAVETEGAASLQTAVSAGAHIGIPAINSLATSLGAKKVAAQAFTYARQLPITSHLVSDRDAVTACARFLEDHRLLVEPACGAALSAVYQPAPFLQDKETVLVIVCGGVGMTLAQLQAWLAMFS